MPEAEVAIRVNHVSKTFNLPHEKHGSLKSLVINPFRKRTYERQQVLNNIDFEVKKGEFFGIVGRNGSGKSTLLKLLASIYVPNKGHIEVRGKLVPFIELGVGFNPELTGRDNVYLNGAMLGFSDKEIDAMYKDIVSFAELEEFMDQKLKNYSSGMQVRLAFSMAIRAKADILLVDEVLAVGDADFQRKCFEYFRRLKKLKKTVVFVTHDMNAVSEYCDSALLLNEGVIAAHGTTRNVVREYYKLFMNEGSESNTQVKSENENRWGNGLAKYTDIKLKHNDKENTININCTIGANEKLDALHFGMHVFSDDGTEITATNNRMVGVEDIKNVEPGKPVHISWEILNIFNDGNYSVTLTLVDDARGVLDWYGEAASFSVKRFERSTTHVLPPIKINIERSA